MSGKLDLAALAGPSCPTSGADDRITLAHGAGAGASGALFEQLLWPAFANEALGDRHDGARLPFGAGDETLALTTDSFVVHPIEFPGGDIGALAVHGTLNDLAMCGAQPLALTCGLVLEEGLPLATLARIAGSMASSARAAGVPIVTGDTKVVERGKGDGLYVNTTGVGRIPAGRRLLPSRVAAGDAVLVSGPLGEHGAAILSVRDGLQFESEIRSDQAWLGPLVESLLEVVPEVHCLRDPTRGGLGAVLHEIATAAGVELSIEEAALPVSGPVRAVCELLGLDPLFLASEGRLVAFVPEARAADALAALRAHPLGRGSARVGCARAGRARVVLETRAGARRLVLLPAGELLPRIC